MTSTSPQDLQALKAYMPFKAVSPATNKFLESSVEIYRCKIGHQLIQRETLPNRIFIVLQGHVRLLGAHHGQPFTLGRMGPGSIVGLASLLRAQPCEQVSAASELLVASLKDKDVLKLIESDEEFRSWCQNHFWLAETCELIDLLTINVATPLGPQELKERAESIHQRVRVVDPAKPLPSQIDSNDQLITASANIEGKSLGDFIDQNQPLPSIRPPLFARLVALDK